MVKIKLEDYSLYTEDKIVYENINICFQFNKLYIKGVNGVGKSLFVKSLMNEIDYKGNIAVNDSKTTNIRCLNQEHLLFNKLTIHEHIRLFKINQNTFEKYISKFKISCNLKSKVSELSGGQKQIISICLILSKDSDLYIFDEPQNNLSEQNVENLYNLFNEIEKNLIVVSHYQLDFFDSVLTIEDRGISYESNQIRKD